MDKKLSLFGLLEDSCKSFKNSWETSKTASFPSLATFPWKQLLALWGKTSNYTPRTRGGMVECCLT